MKIIISVELLAHALTEIDIEKNPISCISVMQGKHLYLYTEGGNCVKKILNCMAAKGYQQEGIVDFNTTEIRWDWILRTIKNIPDQPMEMNITEKRIQLIFNG